MVFKKRRGGRNWWHDPTHRVRPLFSQRVAQRKGIGEGWSERRPAEAGAQQEKMNIAIYWQRVVTSEIKRRGGLEAWLFTLAACLSPRPVGNI